MMRTMHKWIVRITFALALLAAAFISFAPPSLRYVGLALLIAAFALPLVHWIVEEQRRGARSAIFTGVPNQPSSQSSHANLGDTLNGGLLRYAALPVSRSSHINVGGTMGNYYIDVDSVQTGPEQLAIIGQRYVERIFGLQQRIGKIDRLSFIERDAGPIGAIGLLGFITARTGIPSVIIRPRRLLRVGEVKPFGVLQPGSRVVLVADVATGGGTIRRAIEVLRRYIRQKQFHVVLLACREEETLSKLESEGIYLETLYDTSDILEVLKQHRTERTPSSPAVTSP